MGLVGLHSERLSKVFLFYKIMEKEIWKTIEGYEDYMASNLGRVKSLKFGKEKILSQFDDKDGYKRIGIYKNNNIKQTSVHRIIASAFLGNSDLQVNHKNGNRADNRIENLEYVSVRENISHSILNKSKSSKYAGVSFSKGKNKWASTIYINKKTKHLGYFTSELDAHNAYLKTLQENNLTNKYS